MWKSRVTLTYGRMKIKQGCKGCQWSDVDTKTTPGALEQWIDELADRVEIERLVKMGVLVRKEDYSGHVTGKLITKFVRDWHLKDFEKDGTCYKRWMRRSRYVAREFAHEKRLDIFSPATGAHVANLLQLCYLQAASQAQEAPSDDYQVVLASMDVKDAFLMVEQHDPIQVKLHGQSYIIKRNLPGQRLGAKLGMTT